MAQANLLLPKAPRRRQSSRVHDVQVTVRCSDQRCSCDGLVIKCDSGQTMTATFAKNCCESEKMARRAWEGKGQPGELVRELLIEAVEKSFGAVVAILRVHRLEILTDNGGAYIAADTRSVANSLGLTPVNTPVAAYKATAWPRASSTRSNVTMWHPWTCAMQTPCWRN